MQCCLAAQHAARVFAHGEAVELARRGLGMVEALPPSAERDALEALESALGHLLDDRGRRGRQCEPGVLIPDGREPVRSERDRQRAADHEAEVAPARHLGQSGLGVSGERLDHLADARDPLPERRKDVAHEAASEAPALGPGLSEQRPIHVLEVHVTDPVAVGRQHRHGVAATVGEVADVHAPADPRGVRAVEQASGLAGRLDVRADVVVEHDPHPERLDRVREVVQAADEVRPLRIRQAVGLVDVAGLGDSAYATVTTDDEDHASHRARATVTVLTGPAVLTVEYTASPSSATLALSAAVEVARTSLGALEALR